jgi:hypothetical protein
MVGFELLLGHLVGDYIVQNDWMALNKTHTWPKQQSWACSPEYQAWIGNEDHGVWDSGRLRYLSKWGHMLPRHV